MKQKLPSSALASRLRLLKLEPRMLFDGAALAEGVVLADSAEPPPPAEAPANEPDRLAEDALLAEEPSASETPTVATTEQDAADADADLLAETESAQDLADAEGADEGVSDQEEAGIETDTTNATNTTDSLAEADGSADPLALTTEDDEDEAEEVDGMATTPTFNELVVVDARVENHENLLVDMPSNVTVIVVGADDDGLAAISNQLASSSQTFGAIHIISHGTSGSFTLGRDTVGSDNLSGHSETLQGWAQYLTEDADILLYGCDIAAGSEGQNFLQELSHITGADIAASTDATGSSDQGGNWVLEAQIGTIQAGVVLSAAATDGYVGLLAATAVVDSNAAGTRTTTEDTPLAITGVQVNGDSPSDVITLSVVTSGGTSSFGVATGLSFTGANGSGSFSVTGTIANVNAALGSLTYTPESNQNSSTAGFTPSITFNVTAGGAGSVVVDNIAVTAVNDAPDLSTQVNLVVSEGADGAFSLAQLATSGSALDADIGTGQQVIDQQMVQITSLPSQGTLTYQGGVVVVGTVVPVTNLGQLVYTHNGDDLATAASDSFGVNVSDGGGAVTAGTIGITIEPVNVAPTIESDITLIEGQVGVVAPTIDLGDAADTLANAIVVIDNVVTGGQGTLFIDANDDGIVDAGEEITGTTVLTEEQKANLSLLKFAHNGTEPNAPGAITPSYQITVTDSGGGEGIDAAATTVQTIVIEVEPNNDDPELSNAHDTPGTALDVTEHTAIVLTPGMLQLTDVDRDPSNLAQTTPTQQLVYTIQTPPAQGELQIFLGGGAGPDGDGWVVQGPGGRFTQAQLDAGDVRYLQTTSITADTLDGFTFTARDSAFGFDVITDPQNPISGFEGGVRDPSDPAGPIAVQNFYFNILDVPGDGGFGPRTPAALDYDFDSLGLSSNGGTVWEEANTDYLITPAMLEYRITRTEPGPGGQTFEVPANETVYTLENQPSNGVIEHFVDGVWTRVPVNGQFTQADINSGNIRFVHDGSEDHTAAFDYRVSDGTANSITSQFVIDVTPTNDRPTGDGGTAQVLEGDGNAVRLGEDVIGLNDIDLSDDPLKQVGEGAEDFLWFQVTDLPDHGELQRWNGSAWVVVTTDTWLPSTLLGASADGATSGLRYVHDGSEPLTYVGGPHVDFTFVVRDDLADPGDAFATDGSTPPLVDGSVASNQSAPVDAVINIIPVNNAPQIADTPGSADPTIDATITDGGALTGANQILANVAEGTTVVITSAHLTAVDSDNTTVQRQFRITNAPTEGTLLLNGAALGVGSTFTQADIDAGLVSYRHSGDEVGALIAGFGAQYHDKFHFVVNDGVLEDSGNGGDNNVFLITLTPTNDKPTVAVPTGPLNIDSTNPANNPIPGVSVGDPDLADGVAGVETDFIQVTVRLLDSAGNPVTDYSNVNGPASGGVTIGINTPADTSGLWSVTQDGSNNILQIQGTRAQVNEALAGLTVTFANDLDAEFLLQVIADDRLRDATGTLDNTGSDANGGELNQPATPAGAPTAVPGTEYNWVTQTTLAADDPNITADTVRLRASLENDPAVFTGPPTVTVNEDVRTQLTGFVVEDPESEAFNTPVTVTISVPVGHGTLGVGTSGAQTSITPAGGEAVTITGDNTRIVTLTGRASDIEALLNGRNAADTANDPAGGLFYTSALHANGDVNGVADGDVTLTLSFNDTGSRIGDDVGSGSVANNPADITTAVTITAINDAPVVGAAGAPIAVSDSTPTTVTGFQVTDVDSLDGYTDGETDGVIQVTVRLLDDSGVPLTQADYTTLGVTLNSTVAGSGVTVDATLNGSTSALEVRGTLSEINAYLAGLQVTFANLGDSNLDTTYAVEVVADDRLRDAGTGALTDPGDPVANGGENNQQAGVPPVPGTDTFDAYSTTVTGYNIYNVTSNTRDVFISSINDPGQITANDVVISEGSATLVLDTSNANIVLADPDDNGATTMQVTVTVGTGTITAVGGAGGAVAGIGTATITITGATEAQINSRLQALTVTFPDPDGAGPAGNADWNGSFDVTVVYDDRGNTGTRPGSLVGDTDAPGSNPGDYAYADGTSNHLVTTRVFNVTVNPVNDAPTATHTPTNPTANENTDGTGVPPVNLLNPGSISDVDLTSTPGLDGSTFGAGTITVTLTDGITGDQLLVNPTVTAGIAGVTGGAGNTPLVITLNSDATVEEVEAILAAIQFSHSTDNPTVFGTDLTRSYTVVLSDGNNDQAGGDAGGPDALSAPTINGTITLAEHNDPPVAVDDTNVVTEDSGTPATGNVITGVGTPDSTPDSDPDTPIGDLTITEIRTGTEASGGGMSPVGGGTVITGQYGTLTINPDGSYSYVLDDTNPDVNNLLTGETLADVFTYTLSDGTSVDQAQLTITINGRSDHPVLTIPDVNGGEPGHHSIPENATTPVTGTVTIVHPEGEAFIDVTTVTVGGTTTTITRAELNDLATTPVVITGPEGTLTLTGFDPTSGEVSYSYQQDGMTKDHSGGPESVFDTFTFEVIDINGNTSTPRDLVIVVTDTAPVALPDTNTVAEGVGTTPTSTSGNVFGPGGASAGDVEDQLGADPTAVVGIGAGNSTGHLSGNLGTPFAGAYGSIVLNADGTYTYTLNNRNPAVQNLNNGQTLTEVFRYTIMDSDGNASTTTLTITIRGVSDTPAQPTLPPTELPPTPAPERPVSGNGQLELPRNQIRYQRLDVNQIADRLQPRLYVLPAVQEARELVQGKGVDIEHIADIMDPSLYVLPAVEASSKDARDAAKPAIDRFNDSDTDDNGNIVEWSDDAEPAPAKADNADKAQAPEAERPAAVAPEKLSTPIQSLSKPEAKAGATPPVARVEFTEQVRQWAGAQSIRQRAAELDLLFDAPPAPASAEAAPSPQVVDAPQA